MADTNIALAAEGNEGVPQTQAIVLGEENSLEVGRGPIAVQNVDDNRFVFKGESVQLEPSKEGTRGDAVLTEDSHEYAQQDAEGDLSTSQLGIFVRNGSSPRDSDSFVDSTASSPGPIARLAWKRRKSSVIGNSRQATRIDEIISWASKNGQNGVGISGGFRLGKESKASQTGGNNDDIETVLRHLQEIRTRRRQGNGGKCNGPPSAGKTSNASDAFEIIVSWSLAHCTPILLPQNTAFLA